MQLTDDQLDAIIAWAKKTPELEVVILYGSRYRGTAEPTDEVRLGLVMTTKGFGGKQRADNYLQKFETWETDLRAAVGLKMHLISLGIRGAIVRRHGQHGAVAARVSGPPPGQRGKRLRSIPLTNGFN
jgi:ribosomal protein L35AE/L33A